MWLYAMFKLRCSHICCWPAYDNTPLKWSAITFKVLYGVPFTCKEAFGYKGLHCTGGLVFRRHTVASENAVVVQKILDAGGILLATTNVSELCMWWESSNCVYGRSNNPYNTAHMVGGSSGGEAAIIAAGGSVIGIGSGMECLAGNMHQCTPIKYLNKITVNHLAVFSRGNR